MRPRAGSLASAALVLAFVLTGIGLSVALLQPESFAERVLAFVLGATLAFAMVMAAGRLTVLMAGSNRRVAVTEVLTAPTLASGPAAPVRRTALAERSTTSRP